MAADAKRLTERDNRALEALIGRVTAGDRDRVALIQEITDRLATHAHDGHHEFEHLLRKARNLTASPHFDEAFEAFVSALRADLLDAAPVADPPADDRPDEDLGQATKTELYQMAKDAEIPGRSTMTKDELADALSEND